MISTSIFPPAGFVGGLALGRSLLRPVRPGPAAVCPSGRRGDAVDGGEPGRRPGPLVAGGAAVGGVSGRTVLGTLGATAWTGGPTGCAAPGNTGGGPGCGATGWLGTCVAPGRTGGGAARVSASHAPKSPASPSAEIRNTGATERLT